MASTRLNVIALVSGGKDSFFSALHCLENGHHLVALANLHPPLPSVPRGPLAAAGAPPGGGEASSVGAEPSASAGHLGGSLSSGLAGLELGRPASAAAPDEARQVHAASRGSAEGKEGEEQDETDLNSFMYQTVGHQVIPLYAEATGIPLYRKPILGGAVQSGRDYSTAKVAAAADGAEDETESLVPLLQAVIAQHPEANALSAGAILSTYQRTRVESVALRLGLVPLAYLWKYPILPPPPGAGAKDEAQLLFDMAAAGLDARIIKVASGGLDEDHLWENVASARGITRLKKAMGRFGSASLDTGAVLGEGGEFETLVVDGPSTLFRRRVVVGEDDRLVVREGGGTAWARLRDARVEGKTSTDDETTVGVRRPELYDERFQRVLDILSSGTLDDQEDDILPVSQMKSTSCTTRSTSHIQTWAITVPQMNDSLSIQDETFALVDEIHARLSKRNLTLSSILSTVIILRSMADFPSINTIYGSLFTEPNPPTRVTIACGDLLTPSAGNIKIYLTLSDAGGDNNDDDDRQGLHVQSRSYWAPANIGPYSQAITFPIMPQRAAAAAAAARARARAVHIAGQIPLVPASMALPAGAEGPPEVQLALSLQHLWRIGEELSVQWWTGAAVYLPRSAGPARDKAQVAWRAWAEAHAWQSGSPGDDEEDEGGPDLWDRKFNPLYMSYAGEGDAGSKKPGLPDYSILGDDEAKAVVPFLFAVEVDELPRSAEAEWHAHAGLSGLGPSDSDTVRMFRDRREAGGAPFFLQVEHCLLTSEETGGCLHSVVAAEAGPAGAAGGQLEEQIRMANKAFGEDAAKVVGAGEGVELPYLLYVDTSVFGPDQVSQAIREGLAVIPCASIWGGPKATRYGLVALYRTFFCEVDG